MTLAFRLMLARIICSIIPALFPAVVFPQGYTVSGYVRDSLTTESLIGASIYRQGSGQGTVANGYGFYSLTLPAGETGIAYSYAGYGTVLKRFSLQRDTVITVSLVPSQELPEVEITASAPIHENVQMSAINLPVAQIKALPALMGETDVMKTLQLMPGIQSGGEGTTGLYVRGGGPDQNLILLDGVPLYNVSHLFGFMSVFNADAVNNVEVFKGAFPARYGGRVSSVVDVGMKEGNMRKFHGEGSIGLVASKITLEGPIAKDRTSFILSARRTYIDLITKPIVASQNRNSNDKYNAGYYFYDITAKVNYRFSDKDRIYLSLYIHLLANSNVGLPTDLWVPATDRLKPQTSHQVAAGLARTFRQTYEISMEGYYKTMDNVPEYREGASFLNPDNRWEDRVLQGDGRSYGLELFVQKKTGSLTGWIGYTLSWTDRLFEELNNGRRFPYKYDRRHDFSIALIKRLSKNVDLSGTWVFGTGNSISLPVGIYQASNPVQPNLTPETPVYPDYYDFGKRNGYRMAPYHRLDLSVSFMKTTKWGERRWVFGVYNAYSRRNPYYINVEKKEARINGQNYQKYEYIQYSLFPIIPSISYQFKF